MTATKSAETAASVVKAASKPAYVKGSHTASVVVDHEERRTALLARDEVLDGEIRRRQEERDDINEALRLLSHPGEPANVVTLRARE